MSVTSLGKVASLGLPRRVDETNEELTRSAERLASGNRLQNPADEPSGVAIASQMEAQIRGGEQAKRNTMSATTLLQMSEGGLNEINNLLIRMRELAVQAASDTVGDPERELLGVEHEQLKQEIDRIAHSTKQSGIQLIDGNGKPLQFQVGPANNENHRISYDASQVNATAAGLGVDGASVTDSDSAASALDSLDNAIYRVNSYRAQAGAVQARLQSASHTLESAGENLSIALSHQTDTDYARETSHYIKTQIQSRAALAVLAQANQEPAQVLKLLER